MKTVQDVNLERFMGEWFVIASRPTFLEADAHNAKEVYQYDSTSKEIDVKFRFNEDKPDGAIKTIGQTARVFDPITRAHWKISVWWMPVELDYLIIGLSPDYSWTAVGVPNQNYLWIMARDKQMSEEKLQSILKDIEATGYRIDDVKRVPQA
jgi:apolipoprotein D and lipocalin family protein